MKRFLQLVAAVLMLVQSLYGGEPPQSVLSSGNGESETQSVLLPGSVQSVLATSLAQNVLAASDVPDRYLAARERAVRGRRHLAVWVDNPCMPCAQKLPECDHCFVSGPWHGITGPAVVVGQYRDGELWRHDRPGVVNDAAVRAVQEVCGTAGPMMPVGGPQTAASSFQYACGPNGCYPVQNTFTGQPVSYGTVCGPDGCGPTFGGGFGGPVFNGGGSCGPGGCGAPAGFGGPVFNGGGPVFNGGGGRRFFGGGGGFFRGGGRRGGGGGGCGAGGCG